VPFGWVSFRQQSAHTYNAHSLRLGVLSGVLLGVLSVPLPAAAAPRRADLIGAERLFAGEFCETATKSKTKTKFLQGLSQLFAESCGKFRNFWHKIA